MAVRFAPGLVLVELEQPHAGVGIGQLLAWLYQIVDRTSTVVVPGLVGAVVGVAIGIWGWRKGQLGSGLGIYYIFRTLFNALRSIEALIVTLSRYAVAPIRPASPLRCSNSEERPVSDWRLERYAPSNIQP